MSSEWHYTFSSRAQRSMRRPSPNDHRRVLDALDWLVIDPLSGDIRKLCGEQDQWTLRVGSLRIIVVPDMRQQVILVRNVGDRSAIYRDRSADSMAGNEQGKQKPGG